MKDKIIVDLDGTLANIEHRRHLVKKPNHRWREFFERCVDDTPVFPVIRAVQVLCRAGYEVHIFSGRGEEVRPQTERWLNQNMVPYNTLRMRPEKSYTPDEILKRSWLLEDPTFKPSVLLVLDDRDKVVRMWRDEGLTCLQVAPGNF